MATISTTISLIDNISNQLNTIKSNVQGVADALNGMNGDATAAQGTVDSFSWDAFATKAQEAGKKVSDVGRKMTLAISAPLLMLGKKMYTAATDYESAWVGVEKTVDPTVEETERLYAGLLELSEQTPTGFVDLAGIMQMAGQLGVAKDELLGFTETYAGLESATNIAGEEGAATLAKFLNLTEKTTGNIGRVGGVIVDLGNHFATTENDILMMGIRMASAGDLAGFAAPEILALSAALSSVGIRAEAGGTAAAKLMKNMQLAAEVGGKAESMFGADFGNAVNFSHYLEDSKAVLGLAEELGVTTDYIEQLGKSWLNMEYFAEISGKTADQFKAGWADNPAQGMLDFFAGLGGLDVAQGESAIAKLAEMGITEIRLSNLVQAMAGNTELYRNALGMAYEAYFANEETNALWNEVNKRYGTQESENQMLANKATNSMADIGENLVTALQPVLDKANGLLDAFNGLSEVDQDRIISLMGALVIGFPAVWAMGSMATNVGKLIGAFQKFQAWGGVSTLFSKMKSFFTSPVGGVLLIAGAVIGLAAALSAIPSEAERIISNLSNIKITVDNDSVNETLAAIQKVQEASDLLAGGKVTVEAQNTSEAVKRGWGTSSMYGTALGYEAAKANAEVNKIITDYTGKITELQNKIIRSKDSAQNDLWFQEIKSLELAMDIDVGAARERYSAAISELFNGMASQYPESAKVLEDAAKQYDLMAAFEDFEQYYNMDVPDNWGKMSFEAQEAYENEFYERQKNAARNMIKLASELGYLKAPYETVMQQYETDGNLDLLLYGVRDNVLRDLANTVEEVSNNPVLAGFLQSLLTDPTVTENLDFTTLQGALDGMVETLDFKNAADLAVANGKTNEFGQYLVQGLADGVTTNAGLIDPSFSSVRDSALAALQSVFQMQSPSKLMEAQGIYIPQGLALGMLNGVPVVSGAMLLLGGAIIAALAATSIRAVNNAAEILSYSQGNMIGLQIINGLVGGIRGGTGRVVSAMRSMAAAAVRAARLALDIHSPSGVFAEIGLMTGKGYAQGLDRSSAMVDDAMGNLVSFGDVGMNGGIWDAIRGIADLEHQQFLSDDDKEIKISDSDIKAIRELAERETINWFTTAEVKVEFTANNQINSEMDLDGAVDYLADKLTERLEMVAEGVHN